MTTGRRDRLCGVFGLALAGVATLALLTETPAAPGAVQLVRHLDSASQSWQLSVAGPAGNQQDRR